MAALVCTVNICGLSTSYVIFEVLYPVLPCSILLYPVRLTMASNFPHVNIRQTFLCNRSTVTRSHVLLITMDRVSTLLLGGASGTALLLSNEMCGQSVFCQKMRKVRKIQGSKLTSRIFSRVCIVHCHYEYLVNNHFSSVDTATERLVVWRKETSEFKGRSQTYITRSLTLEPAPV